MSKSVKMKVQELVNPNMKMTVIMKQKIRKETAIVMDMMTVTFSSIVGNGIIIRRGNSCE
jgi:hypothetical protein